MAEIKEKGALKIEAYGEENFRQELEDFKAEEFKKIERMKKENEKAAQIAEEDLRIVQGRTDADWQMDFLSSFYCHLPGGFEREAFKKSLEEDGDKDELDTLNKIHDDIDRVIEKLGLDPSQITQWVQKNELLKNAGVLVKIYIEMRRLGYKHYPDLTAS